MIDDRIKYGVYGWIRKAEQELSLYHVPDMISNIIILYFHEDEIFDEITKDLIKSNKDKCVKITQAYDDIGIANAFGLIEINSTNYNQYQWDLKMYPAKQESTNDCVIGITAIERGEYGDLNQILWNDAQLLHYLYFGSVGSIYSPGTGWRKYHAEPMRNNKVSICLDLRKKEIGLIVDGRDQGMVFKDIEVDKVIKYRLVVSLRNKNDSIEIVNFKKE